MSKMVKSIPFEVKIDEQKRTFKGYASTFGNMDLVKDIMQPGAFKKTIAERLPKNQIKVLYQHYEPLGRPIHIEEDSKGLYVEAYISKTTLGNDVLELMHDRVIDRMSIGYDVIKDDYDTESGARLLKEVKLYEFSPVTFPANEEAIIGQVKSIQDLETVLSKTVAGELPRLLKEGRILSKATANKIKTAIDALNEVMAAADNEPDFEPGNTTQKAGAGLFDGIDPLKLQSILANYQKSIKE